MPEGDDRRPGQHFRADRSPLGPPLVRPLSSSGVLDGLPDPLVAGGESP